jgi:hypothetical protein
MSSEYVIPTEAPPSDWRGEVEQSALKADLFTRPFDFAQGRLGATTLYSPITNFHLPITKFN